MLEQEDNGVNVVSDDVENTDNNESQTQSRTKDGKPLLDEVEMISTANSKNAGGSKVWVCKHCKLQFTSSYSRIHVHFFGPPPGKKAEIRRCGAIVKDQEKYEALRKKVCNAEHVGVSKALKNSVISKNQSTFSDKKAGVMERSSVDLKIMHGLRANGIPFNVLCDPQFQEMVVAINEAPVGYKAPSSEKARTVLLDECARDEDFSGVENTGVEISKFLLEAIESIGVSNVFQVVTDNAANCKAAGEEVEKLRQDKRVKVEQWPENHSSNDETVDEHPIISQTEPPSTSGGSITRDVTVSTFISKIKEAQDSSVMGSLASDAFKFFDAIGVDYKPLKEVVASLISHQLKKESLERQKPHWAFKTKALRDASIAEVSKYEEKKSHVDSKYKDVQHRYDAITTHYDRLKEELKNVEEEKVKCEGERAVTEAEKVQSDQLYYKAELKWRIREVEVSGAQKSIDEWETPYNESVDRVNLAKEKLSHLAM